MAIYEVAYHLRMPVHALLEMSYTELQGWFNYFERRPVGWRDDDRTYKLLQAQGVKAKPHQIFPSLQAIMRRDSDNPISTLKGSAMFAKMLQAVGGDKLEL